MITFLFDLAPVLWIAFGAVLAVTVLRTPRLRKLAGDIEFWAVITLAVIFIGLPLLLTEIARYFHGLLYPGRHRGGRYDFPAREVSDPAARSQQQAVEPPAAPGTVPGEATARVSPAEPGTAIDVYARWRAELAREGLDAIAVRPLETLTMPHPLPRRCCPTAPGTAHAEGCVRAPWPTGSQPVYGQAPAERVLRDSGELAAYARTGPTGVLLP